MSKFGLNLSAIMEEFKTDDGFDAEKAQAKLQSQVDGYVAKEKPDLEELKAGLSNDAINDFIKENNIEGVENVDQFKAHVKRMGASATELSEQNSTLSTEFETLKKQNDELLLSTTSLTGELTGLKRNAVVASKGFIGKFQRAVVLEAENRMTEDVDFESALDLVKTEFPEFLDKKQKGVSTPTGGTATLDDEDKTMRAAMGLKD